MNIIEERIKQFKEKIQLKHQILKEEGTAQSEFMAQLNREQLLKGQKGDNTEMPEYIDGSKQPSAPGKINLFDEGDFHSSIFAEVNEKGFDMMSQDKKQVFLVGKFGKILRLNSESVDKLRIKMLPSIKMRFRL